MHLEALVDKLRLIQSELGVELDFTYAKQIREGDDSNNVSLDGTKDFSLHHVANVEATLNKALEEKTRREKEVETLEADLMELCTELGQSFDSSAAYKYFISLQLSLVLF